MRKSVLLATVVAAVFGVAAVAYAANTYTVNVATVSPTKAGTATNPKPTTVTFGYQVGETDGNRPAVTTDYVIGFGPKIKNGRRYFKGNQTCTIAQAGIVSGRPPACPATSKAGSGSVKNLAGLIAVPAQKVSCYLALTLYVGDGKIVPAANNDGRAIRNDLVLALKGQANPNDPSKNCDLAVDSAIPAAFTTFRGGTALTFHVREKPFQEPADGVANSVIDVSSRVGKTVRVPTRIRGRNVLVSHGLFESIGCTRGSHNVAVQFTPKTGAKTVANKTAPCRT
jgi:hypothetical protein